MTKPARGCNRGLCHLGLIWLSLVFPLVADRADASDAPCASFTNLAERLLQSQLGLSLTRLQISPTNTYSPAAHRLLQVTANVYDACRPGDSLDSTSAFPSVFRPLFARDGASLFICGYTNDNAAASAWGWFAGAPDGVPLLVGARKRLPNFNEFVFQTKIDFMRKLELARPTTNSLPNQTNQILLLSLSNFSGVEVWNSYSQSFTNDFQIVVSNILVLTLSNVADSYATSPPPFLAGSSSYAFASTNANWHFDPEFPFQSNYDGGFFIPLYTNIIALPLSRFTGGEFDSATNSFLPRTGQFPVPDWRLMISNRLTFVMSSDGRILDAVGLTFQTNFNLMEMLSTPDIVTPAAIRQMWDTNRIAAPATLTTPTAGILKQLGVSLGNPALSDADWKNFNGSSPSDKTQAIATFHNFGSNSNNISSNLFQQAPFTASRSFLHTMSWQANDPLVHYRMEDLGSSNTLRFLRPNEPFTNVLNLGRLNQSYQPWLGNPTYDPVDDDVALKDPGMFTSDDWNFPVDLMAHPGWLGRIHRGTPWQTIYLKAKAADMTQWILQSSDPRTHPTNDWNIATIFFSLWNTNNPSHLFSVNQTSASDWADIFNGMTVLSNSTPSFSRTPPTVFETNTIDSNSPQVQLLVDGITRTKSNRSPPYFIRTGDLLATPELTTASPWLDFSDEVARWFTLSDEALEIIPEQLLPLLRSDPILSLRWVDGQFHAQAMAFPGYWYALENSSDLHCWKVLATQFAQGEMFQFSEALDAGGGAGFYRLRLVEEPSGP